MKYPDIVIGNVRYQPYALMEMRGVEVVSFKPLNRPNEPQEQRIKHWLKKLIAFAKGSVHQRRTLPCHESISEFLRNRLR